MFEIPGSDVLSVHITEDVVMNKSEPLYIRGKPVSFKVQSRSKDRLHKGIAYICGEESFVFHAA